MKLIAGLGNPGRKYSKNRHNTGFIVLDAYSDKENISWKEEGKFQAQIGRYDDYLLIKPMGYMNNSGFSIGKAMDYFNADPSELIVIHDDLDLNFGDIKVQFGKGSAGHKGVGDIIQSIGTNSFWRIRCGIGRPENTNIQAEDWVLTDFTAEELSQVKQLELEKILERIVIN